ncbi:MAG TPA: GNAT family N-acetyltransferase [Holophagaceae bacterium]|jgi:predicted GNAT family N-acyltransferase|nr:GNAT family N-acetyltransferase [Holophagaceae bacterium]
MMRLAWIASTSPAYALAVALRHEVLRVPLGLAFTVEQLAAESGSHHLAAFDEQGHILGCLLLSPHTDGEVQMRQVAVKPAMQGTGLGRALVEEAERKARELGFTRMMLHARDVAIGFYARLGYAREGDLFIEVGITHQQMAKALN